MFYTYRNTGIPAVDGSLLFRLEHSQGFPTSESAWTALAERFDHFKNPDLFIPSRNEFRVYYYRVNRPVVISEPLNREGGAFA